jgi:hypothetical protein
MKGLQVRLTIIGTILWFKRGFAHSWMTRLVLFPTASEQVTPSQLPPQGSNPTQSLNAAAFPVDCLKTARLFAARAVAKVG